MRLSISDDFTCDPLVLAIPAGEREVHKLGQDQVVTEVDGCVFQAILVLFLNDLSVFNYGFGLHPKSKLVSFFKKPDRLLPLFPEFHFTEIELLGLIHKVLLDVGLYVRVAVKDSQDRHLLI